MTTMIRWSPFMPKFHLHHHHDVDDLLRSFSDGTMDEAAPGAPSWLPAAEGRIEDGTYVIQLALPGVDLKDVAVSYFVREVAYGAYQRDFVLPEGVDAAHAEAKYAKGMLEVKAA